MALTERRGALALIALVALLAGPLSGCAGEPDTGDSTPAVIGDFRARVDDYAALRNKLADSVGPLDPTWSQAQITERSTRLASALIAARAGAKQGDIFTPGVASEFAALILQEYDRRPPAVLEARGDAQDELPDFEPGVNQVYPTTYPLATFPASLLPLLPELPKELEYRIVSRYLVLRDTEANVIIDFMPHAVPREKLP